MKLDSSQFKISRQIKEETSQCRNRCEEVSGHLPHITQRRDASGSKIWRSARLSLVGIRSRSKDNENATTFDGPGLFQIKEKNPFSKSPTP